jgi:hypothetical protein
LAAQGKSVVDAGGAVVEILMTKAGGPVARADLDAWATKYPFVTTTLMDPPGSGTPTFDAWGRREQTFVVELSTMKIVKKISGSIAGVGDSSVKQAIPVILQLLGH